MSVDRPNAPSALRNQQAILEVLQAEVGGAATVLEIGSGTGQHAVFFANALPQLHWQTSDRLENHAGIESWIDYANLTNVDRPLELDTLLPPIIDDRYDLVYSANTAHIMGRDAVSGMFAVVNKALNHGGKFLLYGPFKIDGDFTSPSNESFDSSLRGRDAAMGIRDIEWLEELAETNGLAKTGCYAMPANNMLQIWKKEG